MTKNVATIIAFLFSTLLGIELLGNSRRASPSIA